MAREVTPVELYGQNNSGYKRRFAVLDGQSINKGDILALTTPRTASYAITTGSIFAGIASMDKEASDGSTSISTWQNGVFEMTASGAVTVGQRVKIAAPGNYIMATTNLDNTSSYSLIVGVALETAADGEVINVRVNN